MEKQQYLQCVLQKNMQKQQYLQGFLEHVWKHSNIYQVFWKARAKTTLFTMFSARIMQKQQYLQGFLQQNMQKQQ